MKIFFVNTNKQWGGGEKWHLETAIHMREKGHDVTIMALPRRDLFNKAKASGIKTIPVKVTNISFLNPLRIIALAGIFSKLKPDSIILNFSADLKTVGIAARLARVKDIIYRRGSAIPIRNSPLNRFLFRRIISRIIANSVETKNTILQNNRELFPAEKIRVIYNGINIARFDSIPSQVLYQRKENEVIIGNAGRLSGEKGQHFLIELAALLEKHNFRFTILVAGEGILETSLREKAIKAGVAERIVFLGFVENIKSFMENIDIFVLPSLWEGFGYVTIEAMTCSKPVVAFDIGSNPEIIADGETGLLASHFDVADLTQKVELLVSSPEIRELFGKAGRKRVEDIFDLKKKEIEIEQFLTGS